MFAGHHQPLKVWIRCLYFMGLNLSNEQIASELGVNRSDAHQMTAQRREGLVKKSLRCPCHRRWSVTKPLQLPAIKGSLRW